MLIPFVGPMATAQSVDKIWGYIKKSVSFLITLPHFLSPSERPNVRPLSSQQLLKRTIILMSQHSWESVFRCQQTVYVEKVPIMQPSVLMQTKDRQMVEGEEEEEEEEAYSQWRRWQGSLLRLTRLRKTSSESTVHPEHRLPYSMCSPKM